jgi:hypothetical protein
MKRCAARYRLERFGRCKPRVPPMGCELAGQSRVAGLPDENLLAVRLLAHDHFRITPDEQGLTG